MELIQNPAMPAFALCSAILIFKMIALGHITGYIRMKSGGLASPEDYAAFRVEQGETREHPDVDRYLRAHHNDLESTLPFLAIGLTYLATNPSPGLATGLILSFTFFRLVFTFCYLKGLQPWRSLSFLLGEISVVVMIVQIAIWGVGNWS